MADYPTLIHERVALARSGDNPCVIGRLPSGWAVLGDLQFPLGYSLLLADPVVDQLTDLAGPDRAQFLADMALLGEALLEVTDATRVNYEIQGNTEAALHAHLFPRYEWEEPEFRRGPVWRYPPEARAAEPFREGVHGPLLRDLGRAIAELTVG